MTGASVARRKGGTGVISLGCLSTGDRKIERQQSADEATDVASRRPSSTSAPAFDLSVETNQQSIEILPRPRPGPRWSRGTKYREPSDGWHLGRAGRCRPARRPLSDDVLDGGAAPGRRSSDVSAARGRQASLADREVPEGTGPLGRSRAIFR